MPVAPHRTPAYVRQRGRSGKVGTPERQETEESRGYTGALLAKGRSPKRLCVAVGHMSISRSNEEKQM